MANLTQTASTVKAEPGYGKENGVAGETITAGMPVFEQDVGAGVMKWKASDANSSTLAYCHGIALNNASLDQPIEVMTRGQIYLGSLLTQGEAYFVGISAAGTIRPTADVTANNSEYKIPVGVALSTLLLLFGTTTQHIVYES